MVCQMTTSLARLKDGYTNGGRSVALRFMQSFRSIPVTPNQLTTLGFLLNVVAGVLIYEQHWIWATVVFIVGSVIDALDGALARAHGKMTPFGGFLDSTLDRMSEGVILGAIGLVLADQGHTAALACVFIALVGSFLVSYTRAKAEVLGLKGDVGLMARAERIVLLAVVLPFAGLGVLPYAIYILAALTAITVVQRMASVYSQLQSKSEG
jgi:phosphatidylinositol phosphate synthase